MDKLEIILFRVILPILGIIMAYVVVFFLHTKYL